MAEQKPNRLTEHQVALRTLLLAILGLLVVWILSYLRARPADSGPSAHPLDVIRVFTYVDFLRGFGMMFLQILLSSLIGDAIGLVAGSLILRSARLSQAALRFLRIGLWLPFFVFWALPIWSLRVELRFDIISWMVILTAGVVALLPTVSLAACYYFLTARITLELDRYQARRWVIKETALLALLLCLFFQMWLRPYGWDWFILTLKGERSQGYGALIFLLAFLWMLNSLFRPRFDHSAQLQGSILLREVGDRGSGSIWDVVLLAGLWVLLWQLLSKPLRVFFLINPPLEILAAGYALLIGGMNIPNMDPTIWPHVGVSLIEIICGLVVAAGAALIVFGGLSASDALRSWVLPILPVTYVAPIAIPLLLLEPLRLVGSWQAAAQIAFLTFFPIVQVIWGLRGRPLLCRLLLALDKALPFAFVIMLFGELWAAIRGLGFFIVVTTNMHHIAEGIAASLVTFALLVLLSSTLRWIVKKLYFSEEKKQATPA